VFVVTRAELTGGGTGHGSHDVYPDGWQVTARELARDERDGTWLWREEGREIKFMQQGQAGSHCYNTQRAASVLGEMKLRYVAI
jgi:hypothetical protein